MHQKWRAVFFVVDRLTLKSTAGAECFAQSRNYCFVGSCPLQYLWRFSQNLSGAVPGQFLESFVCIKNSGSIRRVCYQYGVKTIFHQCFQSADI